MDINSLLLQLRSRFISETSIPSEYLLISEVVDAIYQYNWYIGPQSMSGWTTLIRNINNSS